MARVETTGRRAGRVALTSTEAVRKVNRKLSASPLLDMIERERAAVAQKKECEAAIEEARAEMREYLESQGEDKIVVDNYTVTIVEGQSAPRLDKDRLIALGVTAGIIQKATTPGKPYSYVRVSEKGE